MKNILILSLFISCSLLNGFSQLSNRKMPKSFSKIKPVISTKVHNNKKQILAVGDLEKLRLQDLEDDANGVPPRFGNKIEVDFNTQNSGEWIIQDNGDKIWRLEIQSEGAKSLNLIYDEFWLPDGGELHIYNTTKSHIIGAFTSKNNKGTKEKPKRFATGLVYGSSIIVEYFQPVHISSDPVISISHVIHGYRYINLDNFISEGLEVDEDGNPSSYLTSLNTPYENHYMGRGGANPCQVNVACEEGNEWRNEISSVALMIVNGDRWCTGTLLINSAKDNTPYFLTANHCLADLPWTTEENRSRDAVTNPDLSDFMFYWNYQSPTCATASDFIPSSTSGATLVANSYLTDFALMELTENPNDLDNNLEIYYSGWDIGEKVSGGVGIHHPWGDFKKISTFSHVPNVTNLRYIYVHWDATANGFGHTENGSSGSALWNSNHRVIGQLQGSLEKTCEEIYEEGESGTYGFLANSWEIDHWHCEAFNYCFDEVEYPQRRLKDWLDPLNTGLTSFDGDYACEFTYLYPSITNDITITNCQAKAENVIISNNAEVSVDIEYQFIITKDFEIELGSTLDVR